MNNRLSDAVMSVGAAMAVFTICGICSVPAYGDTVISAGMVHEVPETLSDVRHLWVSPDDFSMINGFELKPEGACLGDLCVPLRQDRDSNFFVTRDGKPWINATAFADKIGQAYVVDHDSKTWSFGMVPMTRKSFLESADAPDFSLKDRNGGTVRLSDFRGKKVLIITWASW